MRNKLLISCFFILLLSVSTVSAASSGEGFFSKLVDFIKSLFGITTTQIAQPIGSVPQIEENKEKISKAEPNKTDSNYNSQQIEYYADCPFVCCPVGDESYLPKKCKEENEACVNYECVIRYSKHTTPNCPFECCPEREDDYIPKECEDDKKCVPKKPYDEKEMYICVKKECPHECCTGEVYLQKNCSLFFECVDNNCGEITDPYRLIEDTFKLNIARIEALPVHERLRRCNNVSDCVFIWISYCGAYGTAGGYINKEYQERWKEERIESRNGIGRCYAWSPPFSISSPECVNNVCVWE